MPFYQSILHGNGFRIELDDGPVEAGFYAGRKVHAADACQAERRLREKFLREEKVHSLIEQSREAGSEPRIETDDLFQISMWHYLFGKCPKGFIFYSESESDDDDEEESSR